MAKTKTESKGALQDALEPPFAPLQVQDQGPVPPTAVGVPLPQRFVVGAVGNDPP